ncbi:shikimate dehydrogenase substrate binding domain-containing protein [Sarocladium implicatum]|nr:shikimate dehydrogenase substrate binding domain-containing protein [Sarocladium implicatum]
MAPSALHTDDSQSASKKYHIFGNGISFSVSPIIHNAGFKHDGIPHFYDIRQSTDIDGVAPLIQDESFGGASVTMPHKLQVEKYCDEQTEDARAIGAVNTLVVRREGGKRIVKGDNTDWSGLASLIADYAKTRGGDTLKTGLVIGAGGASRAALYAMHRAGLQNLYVQNRTKSKAEEVRATFAPLFRVTVLDDLNSLPELPDVIIGTVPADTTVESQFANIFGQRGLCIEMSYKPRVTPLLIAARRHEEWATITGIEVLLAQAFDQYRIWTGREAPKEAMINAVEAHEAKMAKLS